MLNDRLASPVPVARFRHRLALVSRDRHASPQFLRRISWKYAHRETEAENHGKTQPEGESPANFPNSGNLETCAPNRRGAQNRDEDDDQALQLFRRVASHPALEARLRSRGGLAT